MMVTRLAQDCIKINLNNSTRHFYVGDISYILELIFGQEWKKDEVYIASKINDNRKAEVVYTKLSWRILKFLLLYDSKKEYRLSKSHIQKLMKQDNLYLFRIIERIKGDLK